MPAEPVEHLSKLHEMPSEPFEDLQGHAATGIGAVEPRSLSRARRSTTTALTLTAGGAELPAGVKAQVTHAGRPEALEEKSYGDQIIGSDAVTMICSRAKHVGRAFLGALRHRQPSNPNNDRGLQPESNSFPSPESRVSSLESSSSPTRPASSSAP